MDYDSHHFVRNVLVELKEDTYAAKPLNVQLVKISHLDVKENFHILPHNHISGELIIPRGEDYECIINGSRTIVKPGQLIMIQPFDRHEDFYHQGGELIFLIFDLHDLSGQVWRSGIISAMAPTKTRVLNIDAGSPLKRLLDLILEQGAENENQMLARVKLGEAFFWQLIADIPAPLLSPQFAGSIEQRIFQSRVMEFFMEIAHEQLNTRQLATRLGMSKRSMEYKFRAVFDASPARAFTAYKIRLAAQMLEHGNSVKAVAEQLGFPDQFYFSTVFKRIMGFPPSRITKNG